MLKAFSRICSVIVTCYRGLAISVDACPSSDEENLAATALASRRIRGLKRRMWRQLHGL